MHVLQLSTFREPCGIATYTEALVSALARAGATTTILAPMLPDDAAGIGTQPPRLWRRNRATMPEALDVLATIGRHAPDLVHVQLNDGLFSLPFLAVVAQGLFRRGIPLVATLHDRPRPSVRGRMKYAGMGLALRHAHLVVHNRAHAVDMALDPRRLDVIPHGVGAIVDSVDGVDGHVARARARADARIGPDDFVFAHFGFLFPDKGVREMMLALAELRARGGIAVPVRYHVCGAVYDQAASAAYRAELVRLVARLGLGDIVHLADGFADADQSLRALASADWIVLNHQAGGVQGTSGAVRHALRSGRPVAVSAAPIFDDVRSAVHTLGAPLADALGALVQRRTLAEHVTALGRAYCEDNAWERIAGMHLALYERVLAAGPRTR